MRIFIILFFLVSCSKDVKVPFVNKDSPKKVNAIIENEFDITYTLVQSISQRNEVCKMSLEIKNISKEEKRNSFPRDRVDDQESHWMGGRSSGESDVDGQNNDDEPQACPLGVFPWGHVDGVAAGELPWR